MSVSDKVVSLTTSQIEPFKWTHTFFVWELLNVNKVNKVSPTKHLNILDVYGYSCVFKNYAWVNFRIVRRQNLITENPDGRLILQFQTIKQADRLYITNRDLLIGITQDKLLLQILCLTECSFGATCKWVSRISVKANLRLLWN